MGWPATGEASGSCGATDFVEQAGGGEARREWQDADLGAGLLERGAFGLIKVLGSVIAAFDVDVGADGFEESDRAGFAENDHGVHAGQGGEDGGAVAFGDEGAVGAFELADGAVGIEADDQEVAELFGALEVADVAVVKEVETAVGGDDGLAAATGGVGPAAGLGEGQELGIAGFGHLDLGLKIGVRSWIIGAWTLTTQGLRVKGF